MLLICVPFLTTLYYSAEHCKDGMLACFNKIPVVVMTPENQSLKADYPTKANFPLIRGS